MGKNKPGAGDVPITLGGENLVLAPSLEACQAINKLAGNSLTAAVSRIMDRLDFDFVVEVVLIGIGESSPSIKKQVAEGIYRQGIVSVAAECVLFIRTIMNGGTRPNDDESLHLLQLVDQMLVGLPDELREEHAPALDALRRTVVAHMAEEAGEEEAADPLPTSESQLESSTTD